MDKPSVITHPIVTKVEHDDAALEREDIKVKVESPSADASLSAQSDEDLYEDAGDLDFSCATQSLYLTRIPKYLWESWCNLPDDDEIELGTVRVEGGLSDVKRMSLLLSPNPSFQRTVPKEYNLQITNRECMNTFIFTEKDLYGYAPRGKIGVKPTSSAAALPPQAPRPAFQGRQRHHSSQTEKGKRWQPYKRTIPKQTALIGQAKTEINCLPVENAQYRQIIDERSRQALLKPRRETKMVDRNPEGNLFAPTIRHPGSFEVGFTKQTKPTAGKSQQPKAARMARNELSDLIFACFKRYNYWPIRAMKEELDQPEIYLRQVLESIAVLIRQGPYSNTWQLKPQYRESSFDHVKDEIAPGPEIPEDQDLDDAGASEDDENVKMEDVLPQ